MKKIIYFSMIMLLVVSALVGCASASAEKIYGKEDTDITVGVGQTFTIELEENPTTGYSWAETISDESVLSLVSSDYQQEPTGTVLVGSGGFRVMTFKGLKAGNATVTVVYERNWEKNPDDETLVYNVTVK